MVFAPGAKSSIDALLVYILSRFVLEKGINFHHYGLKSSMVFKGNTRVYERNCFFNSKYIIRTEFSGEFYQFLTSTENGYGLNRPGLKTAVENSMFWSEIGSGFGEPGGTPLPRIPRRTPSPRGTD